MSSRSSNQKARYVGSRSHHAKGVRSMNDVWREIGRTVRAAMRSTPEAVRLCALIIVVAMIWFLLTLHQGA